MNKLLKRSLAFIGGGVMLLNLIFPSTEVFADSIEAFSCDTINNENAPESGWTEEQLESVVATIGNSCFTSINNAINTIENNETTIELRKNITLESNLVIDNKVIVLSLGDYTITTASGKLVLIRNNSVVTIKAGEN